MGDNIIVVATRW